MNTKTRMIQESSFLQLDIVRASESPSISFWWYPYLHDQFYWAQFDNDSRQDHRLFSIILQKCILPMKNCLECLPSRDSWSWLWIAWSRRVFNWIIFGKNEIIVFEYWWDDGEYKAFIKASTLKSVLQELHFSLPFCRFRDSSETDLVFFKHTTIVLISDWSNLVRQLWVTICDNLTQLIKSLIRYIINT